MGQRHSQQLLTQLRDSRVPSNYSESVREWQPMRTGPAETLVIFDVIFFLNYLIGWLLTWTFNHTKIDDNNVTRVFGVYNICIGVDAFPAQPLAALIFVIAFPFFMATVYLHWVTQYHHKLLPNWLAIPWLLLSLILGGTFGLTYAVPPKGSLRSKIHFLSFATGLLGYMLLKAYAVLEFYMHVNEKWNHWKKQAYVGSMAVQVFFMGYSCWVMIEALMSKDIDAKIRDPVPKHVHFDWWGTGLVLLAAFGPFLQYQLAPNKLLFTARIVDPGHYDVLCELSLGKSKGAEPRA